jgi:hypothetical protein
MGWVNALLRVRFPVRKGNLGFFLTEECSPKITVVFYGHKHPRQTSSFYSMYYQFVFQLLGRQFTEDITAHFSPFSAHSFIPLNFDKKYLNLSIFPDSHRQLFCAGLLQTHE